ncbi:MAG: DUF2283 domain-containing protein [Candidatus Marinimicrobia bacterium]|nr:DUF2283 domain-containing protein [bacterium]MCG2716903.1 DUF2283 domain-containing protein [Candidatus Neomarinimicrobiota bacterium]
MEATAVVNEIFGALPYIKKLGAKHIWFDFDEEADVLYVSLERPQRATDTDILEDGTFLRLRGKKVVGLTITNVSKKFK